jgi:ankyrin repeat protein
MIQLLIDNGADVNKTNIDGKNALLFAIENSNVTNVQFLADRLAENHTADKNDKTVLHYAACQRDFDCLAFIFEYNPMQIDYKDSSGKTALHYAAENSNSEGLEFLVSQGANIETMDKTGIRALHYAASNPSSTCLDALLRMPRDAIDSIDAKDQSGVYFVKNVFFLTDVVCEQAFVASNSKIFMACV